MHQDATEEENDLHEFIRERINNYELLFLHYVTPLLRKELHTAIKLHNEALEDSKLQGDRHYLRQLDLVDERIQEHWTKVYSDVSSHARLMQNIGQFQTYLAAKLLEDYTGKPNTKSDFELEQAYLIERHDSAADESGDEGNGSREDSANGGDDSEDRELLYRAYQVCVVYPLEEALLDPESVEHRLRMAAAGQQYPGGVIRCFISQCDWPNLAKTLLNDRGLTLALAEQVTIKPGLFEDDTKVAVLRGIEKIQSKYFESLSSASTYTISKLAAETSATEASAGSAEKLPSGSTAGQHPEGSSWKTGARSLYNTFTNGLKGGRTIPSLRAVANFSSHKDSFDEKDPLIDSKKTQ